MLFGHHMEVLNCIQFPIYYFTTVCDYWGVDSSYLVSCIEFRSWPQVLDDGDCSDAFPVSNEVKQDCILAPTLFSMTFSAMVTDAFRDCDQGICIMHRMDGKLFNMHRLHAFTKVKKTMLRDSLFADDSALNAGSEPEIQDSMDRFSTACENFDLTISTKN